MNRWIIPGLLLSLGLLTQACGDDDGTDPVVGTGGSAGSGGKAASGGSAGSQATGGSSGSSNAGSGGTGDAGSTSAGAGGSAAGAAGDAGNGGAGGAPTKNKWGALIPGEPLSATEDDRLTGVAFDGDKIIAVGYIGKKSEAGDDRQVAVAKYDMTGKLDKTWLSTGIFTLNLSKYLGLPDDPNTTATDADATVEQAVDVVVQADHKIVVLARTETIGLETPDRTTPSDLVLFRLTPEGVLDKSFGDPLNNDKPLDGYNVISFGEALSRGEGINKVALPDDAPYALDIDAEGRLYVFSSGLTSVAERTDTDRYVVRLSKDGEIDTGFGVDGKATFDVPQSSLAGTNPVTLKLNDNQRHGYVLPDGSIISSGYTQVAGRNQVVLAKFTSAGKLDAAFSNDGVARLAPFPEGMAEAYGVAWQSTGSFVTTGYGAINLEGPSNTDLVSFRVSNKGQFDATWGVSGAFVHDGGALEDRGRYTFALPDDRIVMLGATTPVAKNKDAMVLLLEKDGQVAENLDAAGYKHHDFGGNDEFFGGALSKDGKSIALVGYAATSADLPNLKNGNGTFAILPVGE